MSSVLVVEGCHQAHQTAGVWLTDLLQDQELTCASEFIPPALEPNKCNYFVAGQLHSTAVNLTTLYTCGCKQ